jgi:hypothetical protein
MEAVCCSKTSDRYSSYREVTYQETVISARLKNINFCEEQEPEVLKETDMP